MSCSQVQNEYSDGKVGHDYTISFEYEDQNEVHVAQWNPSVLQFENVERDTWEFQNATTIRFTTAPTAGPWIVYRKTKLEEMEVTFFPGSSIRAQDLNANFEQIQHALQEFGCFKEEFYRLLDEYIWDCRDTYFREDQIAGNATPSDQKITSSAAQAARYDTYLQDGKPDELEYEQGGKRWYDTEVVNNYIWNDQIGAWIDYARTGPQGPKGADGHHQVLIGLQPPKIRPSGDHVQTGDIWFNNCTGETWILYEGAWLSFGTGGIPGPKGATGVATSLISQTAPESRPEGDPLQNGDLWFNTCIGEAFWYYNGQWINFTANGTKGDTGTYQTIVSLTPPKYRKDNSRLQTGDIWFNSCTGEAFLWYDCQWVTFGAAGPPGRDGDRIWIGDRPPLNTAAYPLWYNTDCASQVGLYVWEDVQEVWINTNTPGPKGDDGAPGGVENLNVEQPLAFDGTNLTFNLDPLNILN